MPCAFSTYQNENIKHKSHNTVWKQTVALDTNPNASMSAVVEENHMKLSHRACMSMVP
uniref:Uncharacterized protein n=1 Tax=Rhizophora mucronata TaxID=61149 RepID=A0A2P2PAD4_RHIMU